MKFQQIHHLLILLFVLCCKIIRGGNSEEAKKWHIISGLLFYIEVEQKYTMLDAVENCKSIGMISPLTYPRGFGKYIHNFYGYFPFFWLPEFSDCKSSLSGYILRVEVDNKLEMVQKKCSQKFGFICSINILNGEIQFNNGTHLAINRDDVIKYCDPQGGHANAFDQQNCMIFFEREP